MLTTTWSFLMPIVLGLTGAVFILDIFTPTNKKAENMILKAREVVMSERELERVRENKATLYILDLIPRVEHVIGLEHLILADMRNMLNLMGNPRKPEIELAGYIFYGLVGALPLLIVPWLTGVPIYLVFYPIFVGIIIYQKHHELEIKYEKWQAEVKKDLPELIDKLRISFASGRDYISAFMQARDNSGSRMRKVIDKLINDLQCMRPGQALDLFADSFKMPVVNKFASAVKISIEYGYEAAENYFRIIESDITEVRRSAIEELTKSKPEKVYQLYIAIFSLAVSALIMKGWEVLSQVNQIM